jgi:hypothetical protein
MAKGSKPRHGDDHKYKELMYSDEMRDIDFQCAAALLCMTNNESTRSDYGLTRALGRGFSVGDIRVVTDILLTRGLVTSEDIGQQYKYTITIEGARYLRDNFEQLARDIQTRPEVNQKTAAIFVDAYRRHLE